MKFLMILALIFASTTVWAQTPAPPLVLPLAPAGDFNANRPSEAPTSMDGQEYRIGRDDLIDVQVFEIPSLGTVSRVTAGGTIVLPYVGEIAAAGKTRDELGHFIEAAIRGKLVNDPKVTVFIREYASQPVSVVGAVKIPGIYQLKGKKRLLDVLAMAQGLSLDAGNKIIVIRRKAGELDANAAPDAASETIAIPVTGLIQDGNSDYNIPIEAGDTVNVLNAGSIFVVGELVHPGEYTLKYGRDVTVMQAVSLGSGTTKDAKKSASMVIRPHADGTKEQIPIDIAKIFAGKEPDISMKPNDVLFVPPNKVKSGLNRALDSVLSVVVGRAIYAGF